MATRKGGQNALWLMAVNRSQPWGGSDAPSRVGTASDPHPHLSLCVCILLLSLSRVTMRQASTNVIAYESSGALSGCQLLGFVTLAMRDNCPSSTSSKQNGEAESSHLQSPAGNNCLE